MKYKWLLFDADGTLFDFDKAEKNALKKTFFDLGIIYKENEYLGSYLNINHKLWSDFEKGLITPEKIKKERFMIFFNKLNIDADPSLASKTYLLNLAENSELFSNVENILNILDSKYKMAIITNGLKNVQRRRFEKTSITKKFEHIIISEEIGYSKPNPLFFNIALETINYFDKSKILIIGDSLTSDIQGGINSGIDTCWYNPKQKKNTSMNIKYEINDLKELLNIL